MLRLLDHPRDRPMLAPLIRRELLWRLITGDQGAAVRQLGLADSSLAHVARAVRWIRDNYRESFRVEQVAQGSGMSVSAFYRNFQAVTAMSPIQFQKQFRLQQARLLLATRPGDVTAVGHQVGYDSPSQFSREYRRHFGTPPSRAPPACASPPLPPLGRGQNARPGPGINGAMSELSPPIVRVHGSFLAAMAEFRAEGRGDPEGASMIDREIREFGSRWADPDEFATYVDWLRSQVREDAPRPDGHVPSTTLWWVRDEHYLGRIAIRHRLTPDLREFGGHIGYDVRPSARRQGHATAMLHAALPVARGLGIESALVTCDVTNVASRKVIEANGGALEDQRGVKLRFWVPTGP